MVAAGALIAAGLVTGLLGAGTPRKPRPAIEPTKPASATPV
jgi:hypothetical protein